MSQINNTIGSEQVPTSGAFVGYNAVVQIANTTVSRVQRLSFTVNNNIRQVYVVSSRTPLNVETNFLVRGTIRRVFFNTAMLRLAMGTPATNIPTRPGNFDALVEALMGKQGTEAITPNFATQTDYWKVPPISIECQLYIEHQDGKFYSIKLDNVKFDSFDLTVEANAVVMENVSFVAETIQILRAPTDISGGSSGESGSTGE